MADQLPTARTHLAAGWLVEFVWCKACHHQAPADLQTIIDAGQGDRPLKDLRFRCTACGSRLTDSVTMAKDALRVQPWRGDDADTGAGGHLRGQRPLSGEEG